MPPWAICSTLSPNSVCSSAPKLSIPLLITCSTLVLDSEELTLALSRLPTTALTTLPMLSPKLMLLTLAANAPAPPIACSVICSTEPSRTATGSFSRLCMLLPTTLSTALLTSMFSILALSRLVTTARTTLPTPVPRDATGSLVFSRLLTAFSTSNSRRECNSVKLRVKLRSWRVVVGSVANRPMMLVILCSTRLLINSASVSERVPMPSIVPSSRLGRTSVALLFSKSPSSLSCWLAEAIIWLACSSVITSKAAKSLCRVDFA